MYPISSVTTVVYYNNRTKDNCASSKSFGLFCYLAKVEFRVLHELRMLPYFVDLSCTFFSPVMCFA